MTAATSKGLSAVPARGYSVAILDKHVEVDAKEALLAGESEAVRTQWKATKAALIEEGLADPRAGRVIGFEAVSAWIDSLGTDHELPRPELRQ